MEVNSEKNKWFFFGVIVVLVVTTSYMTTAYLIHAPPFHKKIDKVPETAISDVAEEIGAEGYEVSFGNRTVFDGFSMVFPKEWILMSTAESSAILAMKPENMDVSVSITRIKMDRELPEDHEDVQAFLSDSLDSWFARADVSSTLFLDRQSYLFSGLFERANKNDAMLSLVVPENEVFYVITGLYPADGDNRQVIEDIISTFRLALDD
jgi:hypothetical protein